MPPASPRSRRTLLALCASAAFAGCTSDASGDFDPREHDCGDTGPIQLRNNDDRAHELSLRIARDDETILREAYDVGGDGTESDVRTLEERLAYGRTYEVRVRTNEAEYGPERVTATDGGILTIRVEDTGDLDVAYTGACD